MFTKTKSIILSLALVGGMTAFVQAQDETQQQQQAPQMQQQQQQDIDVNDDELEEFANVYQTVMQKNQEAQEELVQTIKDEGLTVEEYQKFRQAENNPDAEGAEEASGDDKKKKENIDAKIEEMEPKLQKQQTDIIEDSELSVDRYQKIAMALRSDQDLQQKLQKILMDKDSAQ